MGIDIIIYAEVCDGAVWKAKPASFEKINSGVFEIGPLLEPRSLYFEKDRGLYSLMAGEQGINLKLATPEQLNSYRSSSQMITHRSFPEDVSDELLDRYCRNYYDCYLEEVIPQTIRQQAKKDQKVSWLSLEELNSFDWFGYQGRGYGQVKPRHVALFGDGEQMWQDAMYDKVLRWVYYPLRGEAPIPNNNGCEAGYVQVSWIETQNQPYAETAGSIFMQHLLPLLRSYGSPKEVRIIFWLNA